MARLRPTQVAIAGAEELQIGRIMALADEVDFATGDKLLGGILPHQLMQVKATLPVRAHQRLVHQTHQDGKCSVGHLRSFLQRPAAPKDAHAPQHTLFERGEQAPGLVKEAAQAAMAFGHIAQRRGENVACSAQAGGQSRRRT